MHAWDTRGPRLEAGLGLITAPNFVGESETVVPSDRVDASNVSGWCHAHSEIGWGCKNVEKRKKVLNGVLVSELV
jgi:hypothetical protein